MPPEVWSHAAGYLSCSPMYTWLAMPISRKLFKQAVHCAAALADNTAGISNATSIPIMTITTSTSTSVNPCCPGR